MNYYQILEISEKATQEEIKLAYRKLAKKYHPDLNQGDTYATEIFQRISEAYDVLADEVRRDSYDWQISTPVYESSSSTSDNTHSGTSQNKPFGQTNQQGHTPHSNSTRFTTQPTVDRSVKRKAFIWVVGVLIAILLPIVVGILTESAALAMYTIAGYMVLAIGFNIFRAIRGFVQFKIKRQGTPRPPLTEAQRLHRRRNQVGIAIGGGIPLSFFLTITFEAGYLLAFVFWGGIVLFFLISAWDQTTGKKRW